MRVSVPMKKAWIARDLVSRGATVKEAATELCISEAFVRRYTKAERAREKEKEKERRKAANT